MEHIITVDDIEDGMVLAEEIKNSVGQILIPEGVTLQNKHIRLLKNQKIQTISIKSDEDDEKIEITEDIKTEALGILMKRLAWKPELMMEKEIFHMAYMNLAENLAKKQQGKK